ncbi:MAG: YfcC family protein [Oscillospiraceae bacterium]|nr:YfcC family protein [Oscillospiraceae bacterium]
MNSREEKKSRDGIHIDKKTIIGITALLLAVWIAAGALTHIIPRGEYSTFIDSESGKAAITTESEYSSLEDYTMPIWKIIAAPVMVFVDSETRDTGLTGMLIIAFIVLMGGTFLLLDRAGVLKYLVAVIIKRFSSKKYLLMAVIVFFFMLLASTAGILEESVTLVPISVAVALALGWDSLVGLGMSLIAVAFGFTAATFNPFNVMTVQKLAGDIEVFSGLWLRLIVFALVYAVLMLFLIVYAKRIEKNPKKSLAYESDKAIRDKYDVSDLEGILGNEKCKKASAAFAGCLGMALVCIMLDVVLGLGGTLSMGGIAVFFVSGGLIAAYLSGLRGRMLLSGFGEGIKSIAPALPLIVIVIAIAYILNTGKIMHTILFYIHSVLQNVSPFGAVLLIFVFIALLEFFIGSGTAKAFLVMPLVIPLAHLIGISSNTVALTFAMADGFTNLLYPTSGIMIIAIGLIGVSYAKWLKFSWKLFVLEGIVAVAVMFFAVAVGYH